MYIQVFIQSTAYFRTTILLFWRNLPMVGLRFSAKLSIAHLREEARVSLREGRVSGERGARWCNT